MVRHHLSEARSTITLKGMVINLFGKYSSYAELSQCEQYGKDYRITVRQIKSPFIIASIHGGAIEPGTSDIADYVAGEDFSYYAFEGIKQKSNWDLHITSTRFDEPCFNRAANITHKIISIHGCSETGSHVLLGGLDHSLIDEVGAELSSRGFLLRKKDQFNRMGMDPMNACNRGISGKGLQIEISGGLRKRLFTSYDQTICRRMTPLFFEMVFAIRMGLFKNLKMGQFP